MTDDVRLPEDNPVDGNAAPESRKGRSRYDPAFEPAVKSGLLTPYEAYSRGKRESYALGLIARFALTEELAYSVADNEMTLMAARSAMPVVPEAPNKPKSPNLARGVIYSLVVVVAVIAAGVFWSRSERLPEPSHADAERLARGIHADDFGDVIRVVGDSPQQVLVRFCGANPEFDAHGLMASNSGAVPVRIGVLETRSAPGEFLAIPIREDRHTGKWFAGDGSRAVVPVPAPPGASQAAWPTAR